MIAKRYGATLDQSTGDIALIQRLLDDKVLSQEQKWELKSLGGVFGCIMAYNIHGLDWWIVEDEYGRDPTIRYEETTLCLNAVTMISKRVEDEEDVDVKFIYDSVLSKLEELKGKTD